MRLSVLSVIACGQMDARDYRLLGRRSRLHVEGLLTCGKGGWPRRYSLGEDSFQ